jgi:hypothetical protein
VPNNKNGVPQLQSLNTPIDILDRQAPRQAKMHSLDAIVEFRLKCCKYGIARLSPVVDFLRMAPGRAAGAIGCMFRAVASARSRINGTHDK